MKVFLKRACVFLTCGLMLAAPVMAGENPAPASSLVSDGAVNWDDIETVIVHPPESAPAMWHVQKGNSEIWLIGMPGLAPEGNFTFNEKPMVAAITGAKTFYTLPEGNTGTVSMLWFFMTHSFTLPDGQHLTDTLPPDVAARLKRDMDMAGVPPEKYQQDTPLRAGLRLMNGMEKKLKLSGGGAKQLEKFMKNVADDNRVEIESPGEFGIMPVLRQLADLPPQEAEPCLNMVMGRVERWKNDIPKQFEAWRLGDVGALKAAYVQSQFSGCPVPAIRKSMQSRRAVIRSALVRALKTPGKTVMLLSLSDLLVDDGALKQLSDMGLKVEEVSAGPEAGEAK